MNNRTDVSRIYGALILVLSLYVLVELAIEIIYTFPANVVQTLAKIDFVICMLFLTDWLWSLCLATNKRLFFVNHLFDLASSIPFYNGLRVFRLARIIRIIRVFRVLRGLAATFPILRFIAKSKQRSVLVIYTVATLIIFFYCSVGLYHFEHGVNGKFTNFGEALWCAFTSLTTVGYGDIYPITWGGRVMAGILVITGLGLFSLLTAEIATVFMKYLKQPEPEAK
jgi:voltage-gated potassium channel